jgi:hypothetical protein
MPFSYKLFKNVSFPCNFFETGFVDKCASIGREKFTVVANKDGTLLRGCNVSLTLLRRTFLLLCVGVQWYLSFYSKMIKPRKKVKSINFKKKTFGLVF